MPETKTVTLSQRCRALAEECRSKAQSFRNDKACIQMFQLAAGYDRKANLADALETSLLAEYENDAPLVPDMFTSFLASFRKCKQV